MQVDSDALAAMAHELRTPINAVLGYSELLHRRVREDDLGRYAASLVEAAQMLSTTVDAMLDMARIERGEMRLDETRFDVGAELAAAARILKPTADRRGIRILTSLGGRLPALRGDARLIRQLFANLLSNALKYGDENSRIIVTADTVPGGDLEIRIQDTGLGLRPGDLESAFDPFNRLGRGEDIAGTGIGLPLCRAIADLHGGDVRLESTVGVGTTAIVTLPSGRLLRGASGPQQSFDFSAS